ncbi:Phosphoribosylformylglycineamidine synthase glutamine amidotransferase subunit [Patulibacter medicamentivorans]|jgi:phosphoribosylformylglycinamidine synthase|uniref:Phosphoribosylformylglycinamidine synthase subunit PurQ n=1 Tax=Patulibacter medicamentivorans TaxID=1097667 RepID=H0EBK1_9ACTN|nr:phosphoribosylformylglycinamidine synthase subunit PurQ [Patulibacter medicamentivorans]EHN08948.1 Phosphoribosylformylglycineamidine synthase glutamine amidotransferase subunit [Patulibacter medicamentivorans]
MRVGVVQFPGSCDEVDALLAAERAVGAGNAELLWHRDRDLKGVDAVVVPGGFSYGDYLRAGAIAALSPAMESVAAFARDGGPVLGICNGFQVLCEAGLLPGTMLMNVGRRFVFRQVELDVVAADTAWTRATRRGQLLSIPAKHQTGRWYAPDETVERLVADDQVVFRYAAGDNYNGSSDGIAGVCNAARNVVGLMPHPEHAVDPLTGSADGLLLFRSPLEAAGVA